VQYKKDGPSDSSLVGTAYHRLLEFLDFQKTAQDGKVSMEYITERLATLITNGVIEGRIAEMINLDHVAKFFESPIGQRVINAALRETLEKEKPFTMKYTVNGTEVLLQGVIDCCFEEDGEMVIVDYKTNRL
jgi:ATP-dependent helicase/nuclease subunit A